MTAREIKAELALRGMTIRQLAREINMSYSYALKITQGRRTAEGRRAEITNYLHETDRRTA